MFVNCKVNLCIEISILFYLTVHGFQILSQNYFRVQYLYSAGISYKLRYRQQTKVQILSSKSIWYLGLIYFKNLPKNKWECQKKWLNNNKHNNNSDDLLTSRHTDGGKNYSKYDFSFLKLFKANSVAKPFLVNPLVLKSLNKIEFKMETISRRLNLNFSLLYNA